MTIAIAPHQRLTGQRGFSLPRTLTSSNSPLLIQPKLTIGAPEDKYEEEAERVAEHVMRMPGPRLQSRAAPEDEKEKELLRTETLVQRQGKLEGEQEDEELLQTKPLLQQRVNDGAGMPSETPPVVHEVLRSPGQPLDPATRAFMEPRFGRDFSQVRVHTDAKASESARVVNSVAYTVGQDAVFGQGRFAPFSMAGRQLLAHELAHTVQQRGAVMPSLEKLKVSSPGDRHERQAEHVARSVVRATGFRSAKDGEAAEKPEAVFAGSPVRVARLQRVISFTTAAGTFTTNNVVANEDGTGFTLGSPIPTFQWQPDVIIHGDAGDVFADWEVAHHQVGKADWLNVWWGTGADRTHRHQTVTGGLPIRDATAAGNTWYSDWRAQRFAADGDVRSPIMRDTPSERIPWASPIVTRGGTRGWFNFGLGFVSTLSARHIPDGTGAAAFRHLDHVHWNFSVDGTFDITLPVPGRVALNGGAINTSRMIPGVDVDNPPMRGGPVFVDNLVNTDT
ncbi:MAG: DUF4157 domain-containing protein [Desulfobacterales bacterium]|nr:MAG: DUF4157 domain-containing protein [Desulfobacterales bacterium]